MFGVFLEFTFVLTDNYNVLLSFAFTFQTEFSSTRSIGRLVTSIFLTSPESLCSFNANTTCN